MRFASIEIENYRQYKHLVLGFRKGKNDLQIIVGDNGTGKTNLLNAFTWCLYGKEPHLGSESKTKGEPKLNKSVILEMVEGGIEREDVNVKIEIEIENGMIRVYRNMPFRVKGINSVTELHHESVLKVVIIRGDGSKTYVGDGAQEQLNRILPESIREYFFFDGEQLDNYFEDSRNEILKNAVHSISNIDSLARMRKRTSATTQDILRKASPKKDTGIEEILKRIHKLEKDCETIEGNVADDKTTLGEIDAALGSLEEKLRGMPDVAKLETRISHLKNQKRVSEEAYAAAVESYCAFAREMYVDFSFYEAARAALDAIDLMEKGKQLPPSIDSSYLRSMLETHICKVCMRPLSSDEEAHIRELLELYQVGTETASLLIAMRSELQSLVRRVEGYPRKKATAFKQLDSAKGNLDQIINELEAAEKDYSGCPNPEQLKLLREERKSLETQRDRVVADIGRREGYIVQHQHALRTKRDAYAKAVREKGRGEELQVVADFGQRAERILASVEKEIIHETRKMIEEQAGVLFKNLVWKDSKCDSICLTENYHLSLFDKYGFSCAGTCSAAERNLLALSFTLAMHQVSGFESPMFIDTPIARASGDNRTNFAETLAVVSQEKQLILTFTPDEYSETIASVFDPIAASNLRLSMDGSEMVVSIKGGE